MEIDYPKLKDNDRDMIIVEVNGEELRGWSYDNDSEHYLKTRMANEFCEGWLCGCRAGLNRAQQLVNEALDVKHVEE